jgi:colanic acid/amylovoran biosynthesis glycosyltransferase
MSIAYLIPSYPMPSQTFIRREIAGLEARGLTIHRFAMRRFPGGPTDPADWTEQDRTHYILDCGARGLAWALAAEALSRPGRWLSTLRAAVGMGRRSEKGVVWHLIYLAEACYLRRRLSGHGVRHLHAHFGTNGAAVAMLCRLLGGPPYSVTMHGPEEFDAPRPLGLREKVRHAAFVVAISQFTRSQLLRWSDYRDWSKIRVIYAGVNPVYLEHGPAPIPEAPRLVNIGRIVEQKGQVMLIEAAALLMKRGYDFEIVIVSDGPMRDEINRLIDRLGLGGRIQITGHVDDQRVFQEILAARALVLPSFAEGLPSVFLEAMALGRPVIGTAIAGHPELIEPGVSGWLIPAGSVEPLAEAMAEVLSADPAELEPMGRAGAAQVAEQHDPRTAIDQLASLLASSAGLADRPGPHAPTASPQGAATL